MDTLIQVLEQEPISPRQLNITVDVDLEAICLKSQQKEPRRSDQTAGQLGDDLRRSINGD